MVFTAVTTPVMAGGAMAGLINARGSAPAEARLDAYRSNVAAAHISALDHAFPVTREVLGARYWQQLLAAEIHTFAATQADLHAYGDFVPGLLRAAQRRQPELADFPYLADLAALEWGIHAVRFVPDAPAFDWQAFAALSGAQQTQASLIVSAALKVFCADYPVDVIWHSHQQADDLNSEHETQLACCVHRVNRFDVTVTRISVASADLLFALGNGASLAIIAEADAEQSSQALVRQLYAWIQRGWIVGFEVR